MPTPLWLLLAMGAAMGADPGAPLVGGDGWVPPPPPPPPPPPEPGVQLPPLARDRLVYGNSYEINGERVAPADVVVVVDQYGSPVEYRVAGPDGQVQSYQPSQVRHRSHDEPILVESYGDVLVREMQAMARDMRAGSPALGGGSEAMATLEAMEREVQRLRVAPATSKPRVDPEELARLLEEDRLAHKRRQLDRQRKTRKKQRKKAKRKQGRGPSRGRR